MAYQPFLIAPFKTGLDTDLEPWLLPQDAFTDIINGHIHHGFVEKREGYRFLGEMVHGQAITAATNANPAVFTVGSTAGINTGDTVSLHYLAGGTWDTLNAQKYTVTVTGGTTFTLTDSSGTAVDGTALGVYTASSGRLGTFENLRIMGIMRYIDASNTRLLLISDTERVAIYNSTNNIFEPLDLFDSTGVLRTNSDVWASTDTDYIWEENWQAANLKNRMYLTNGKEFVTGPPGTDGIVFYETPSSGNTERVEQFQPSLNATDTLYGCKLIFSIKQLLVCLYTFENNGVSTSAFPQRARWCAAQNPSNWDDSVAGGGGFVDAPTGDQIISARALQDVIIAMFTDSVWALRYVQANPSLPFRWEKINNFRSCDGKMATVGFDRYVMAAGIRGITATDGVETRRVDERIDDFASSEVNADQFGKVFGERSYSNRRTWMLYPDGEESDEEAASALIYDDESGAFSKYQFTREVGGSIVDMNVLGYGTAAIDYAAQDFTEANGLDKAAKDFEDETAFSFFWGQNSELFLGGDRNGFVFIMETEGSDFGTPIEFILDGAGWNPYKEKGIEAQLGYVDFYCDSDQVTELKVDFFKNDNDDPYASQFLNLLPDLTFKSAVVDITPNSDPTTGFVIASPSNGVTAGEQFYIYGAGGASFYNDNLFEADSVTENTVSVAEDITSFGATIVAPGISQANPAVVTVTSHPFSDGDTVTIVGVVGMTEVNGGTFIVANSSSTTFDLQGVDSTGFTAWSSGGYVFHEYSSGGQIVERRFYRTKVWKRAYAGGIGYVHNIRISDQGSNRPLKIHAFKPWFRPRGRRTLG